MTVEKSENRIKKERKMTRKGLILTLALVVFAATYIKAEETKKVSENMAKGLDIEAEILKVGDSVITHRDLYLALIKKYGDVMLNVLAEDLVIEKEAEKRKMTIDKKEIREEIDILKSQFKTEKDFNIFLTKKQLPLVELERQLKIKKLQKKMVEKDEKIKITSSDIKEFFEKNKEKFATPELIKLSHILVETKEGAEEIVAILAAGADFGKLAAVKSIDESTKSKAGALGIYRKGVLNPNLEKVLFSMKTLEVSKPVSSDLGWHVFMVAEKTDSKDAELTKDLKERIEKVLKEQKFKEVYSKWLKKTSENWIKK